MAKQGFNYLVSVQYLGFRYSGWQTQPGQKTIESMLSKTFSFMFPEQKFKILGASRTDARVSALEAAFELQLKTELQGLDSFLFKFNQNLPADIRLTSIEKTTKDFNIIKSAKEKEYVYLFSFGEKNHPFAAPFMINIIDELDIDVMIKGAKLFEGIHDFSVYSAKLKENSKVKRNVILCQIEENKLFKANFFPQKSYVLKVRGKGFLRYQIRMMMGALLQLGKGELDLLTIEKSLLPNSSFKLTTIAPGSGLLLNKLSF